METSFRCASRCVDHKSRLITWKNDAHVKAVPVKRGGTGGTEVSAKITCKTKKKCFEIVAYVAIMEGILSSEIKRRRESRGKRRKGGVEEKD